MLLDDNFEMQGGVRNYLGKTEEVKAPKYWKSSKDSPSTELAYITEAEKNLLLDANLHGSLKNGKPNVGASGLLSYDGWGDASDGFGSNDNSNNNNGDNNREQYGAVGQDDRTRDDPDNPGGDAVITPPTVIVGGQEFAYDDPRAVEAQNTVEKESLLSNVIDLYQQNSPLNLALNLGETL